MPKRANHGLANFKNHAVSIRSSPFLLSLLTTEPRIIKINAGDVNHRTRSHFYFGRTARSGTQPM